MLLESTVIATGKRVEDEHLEIEVADSAALFAGFEGAIEDYLAKDGSNCPNVVRVFLSCTNSAAVPSYW